MFQTNLQLILNHVMMLIHACMLFSCYLLFFIWHDNHDSVKFLLFRVMIMEDKKFKSQTRYCSSMSPSYFIIQIYTSNKSFCRFLLRFWFSIIGCALWNIILDSPKEQHQNVHLYLSKNKQRCGTKRPNFIRQF